MPVQNYLIEILADVFPALRMELICVNAEDEYYKNKELRGKVSFDEGDERIELELYGYYSNLTVQTVGPYRGIIARAPFITYFADPMSNGYMTTKCELTGKGYYHLYTLLRQVVHIHRLVKASPNTAFELYATLYSKIVKRDPNAKFGELKLGSGSAVTRSLATVVKKRYGFEPLWSPDLVRSLEAIVVNHPELFSAKWN